MLSPRPAGEVPIFADHDPVSDAIYTVGSWDSEEESAVAFDQRISSSQLFRVYSEVLGDIIQPHPWQQFEGRLRIDRILVPNEKFNGFNLGVIGVELKKSHAKIGRPFSQMIDYSRCAWRITRGIRVMTNFVFLWPAEKFGGPLASLCAQQHLGIARPSFAGGIDFYCGEHRICTINREKFDLGNLNVGQSTGSR